LHKFGIEQQHLVFSDAIDAKGAVVDRDKLLGLFERSRRHLKRRKAADLDRAIEPPIPTFADGGDLRCDWPCRGAGLWLAEQNSPLFCR
jgi:hypothetical protein